MNLYKLTQNKNNGYDTYDSIIVAARSEKEAKMINPSFYGWDQSRTYQEWCQSPEDVKCELIGMANDGIESGIVLASFNAG